jgi:hypothetical protein
MVALCETDLQYRYAEYTVFLAMQNSGLSSGAMAVLLEEYTIR